MVDALAAPELTVEIEGMAALPPDEPGGVPRALPRAAFGGVAGPPGLPPGAAPVTEALHEAVSAWSSGEVDWLAWDAAAADARPLFARLIGADGGALDAAAGSASRG